MCRHNGTERSGHNDRQMAGKGRPESGPLTDPPTLKVALMRALKLRLQLELQPRLRPDSQANRLQGAKGRAGGQVRRVSGERLRQQTTGAKSTGGSGVAGGDLGCKKGERWPAVKGQKGLRRGPTIWRERPATGRAALWLPWSLLLLAALAQLGRSSPLSARHLDTCEQPDNMVVLVARQPAGLKLSAELLHQLRVLRCAVKPAVVTFERLMRAAGLGPGSAGGLRLMSQRVDSFQEELASIMEQPSYCTLSMVERLARLRDRSGGSELLLLLFDVLAMQFHESCLADALSRLPSVPYVVRDVVDIYIRGADSALPNLNSEPVQAEQADEFKVNEALERSGELSDVVSLLLFSHSGSGSVQMFKDKCRELVLQVDQSWQPMEMMNRMLATEGNGIQLFNNYVVRQLMPTKYADVCSRLSEAS